MKPIIIDNEKMAISMERYLNNNAMAITIYCIDNSIVEPYLDVTTNIDEANTILEDNQILVKTWSENEKYIDELLNSGYFKDTGKRIPINLVVAHVWEIQKEITGDLDFDINDYLINSEGV